MLKYYQVCSNDDPELNLTYFTTRSNLVPYAFVWKKGKTMDFSETVLVYDQSKCIFMNIKDQRHSLNLVQGHSDATYSNFFSFAARLIQPNFMWSHLGMGE